MNDLADTSHANPLFDLVSQEACSPDTSTRASELGFSVLIRCDNLGRRTKAFLPQLLPKTGYEHLKHRRRLQK